MLLKKGVRYGDRTNPAGKFLTLGNLKEEIKKYPAKKTFLSTLKMIKTNSIEI